MSAARDILRQLSALGARVECRGERVVLCTGSRPVPPELIDAARQVKAELSKVLNAAEGAQSVRSEHLRWSTRGNPKVSAVSVEDAHLSTFDERLGADRSKMLTEDAHLSTFDEPEDFRGSREGPQSKMLNSSQVTIFGTGDERLPRGPEDARTWDEAVEERAAIVEQGKIPPDWAEGFARLDVDRAPVDVPPKRWQRFVDDVGLFLDSPFRYVATALGWGPLESFGCDRDRPFARIDQAGLLWLLNGNKLVALTEDTAGIATPTGAWQTYRRKTGAPGRVLAWELAP